MKVFLFFVTLGVLLVANYAMGFPLTLDRFNQLITLSGLEVILGFDNLR
jgi:hypothetical protein